VLAGWPPARPRAAAALAALAAVGVLAACGGSPHRAAGSSAPSTGPASSPASSAAAAPAVNPLTGLQPSRNPVVAVKIEDTPEARPQVGLEQADIVYIEQVEGGLTRLVAVFDSTLPTRVGPVRSTRNDDPEIMAQYGPVIYVASGGSPEEYKPLDHSTLRAVINDRGGPGFSRAGNRPIPHNLFADLRYIAARVKGPRARAIGLVWSRGLANVSKPGLAVSTRVGATPVVFRWSWGTHRYVRYYAGSPDRSATGRAISTPNVIVQFVRGNSFPADIDPAGNPAWYQHTVGSGRVVVFRNGRRIDGRWRRPAATDGTTLTDASGKPIALAPGGAWFVLVDNGVPLAG
jgi:hypothetical protein